MVGSFIITLITTFFLYSGIDPLYRYLFITGFLGALTTFSSFTFVNIGRLHPQKNQKMLIEAFYHLNDPHAKLVIIGEGELKEELENLIKDLDIMDRVFLLGRQSNPFAYLSKADTFVLSSDFSPV